MTTRDLDRRRFLTNSARTGIALCGACLCGRLPLLAEEGGDEPIDPTKLNYCGYQCPDDCKFLQATLEDDVELKREAHKLWKIEERLGIEFDPETAICYGCKAEGKPEGVVVSNCGVRDCAREKKIDCCIECDDLKACEQDLWTRFPKFKEQVITMQEKYRAQA